MRNYNVEAEHILKEFNRLVFEETNWTLEKEKHGVKVSSVMTGSSQKHKCYKGEALVEMPPGKIIDIVHPFGKYRLEFDPNLTHCEVVEELGPTAAVAYQVIKPKVLGVKIPGDSIDLFVYDKNNHGFYSVFGSIQYDQPFTKKEGTRGWAHPSGLIAFKTDDPNVAKVITIYHAEFDLPVGILMPVVHATTVKGVVKYFKNLRLMKDVKYEPFGKETILCRNR